MVISVYESVERRLTSLVSKIQSWRKVGTFLNEAADNLLKRPYLSMHFLHIIKYILILYICSFTQFSSVITNSTLLSNNAVMLKLQTIKQSRQVKDLESKQLMHYLSNGHTSNSEFDYCYRMGRWWWHSRCLPPLLEWYIIPQNIGLQRCFR